MTRFPCVACAQARLRPLWLLSCACVTQIFDITLGCERDDVATPLNLALSTVNSKNQAPALPVGSLGMLLKHPKSEFMRFNQSRSDALSLIQIHPLTLRSESSSDLI